MKYVLVTIAIVFGIACSPRVAHAQAIKISDITAVASAQSATHPAPYAVDGNIASSWNAGSGEPQWILLDLPSTFTVNKLELIVAQAPAGRTKHIIETSPDNKTFSHLITLDQITTSGQKITIPLLVPQPNVRYIKITTTLSPSWIAWNEISVFSGTTSVNTHLRYFGYMSSEGLGGGMSPSYLSELGALGNTNIAWAYKADLLALRAKGIKGLMTEPRWYFFDANHNLRSDWQQQWLTYKESLRGYENDIYGFYFDEPFWYGYPKDAFLTATRAIREDFPDKAIVIFEPYPHILDGTIPLGYYQYVTDIGHDYYITLRYPDNDDGWAQYLEQLERFKSHMQGKRFWVVADGYNDHNASTMSRWLDAFEKHLSLVLTHDMGTGIFTFAYNKTNAFVDLRDALLPSSPYYDSRLRSRHIQIGKQIIALNTPILQTPTRMITPQSPSPTSEETAISGDLDGNGDIDIFDYNILLGNFGRTGNPGFIPADINRDGHVDIFDYNILLQNFGT